MAAPLDPRLDALLRREAAASTSAELVRIGEAWEELARALPGDPVVLVHRNRFRLEHQGHVPRDRPRVLVGGMNEGRFPNFHTLPLLRLADVVSLTTGPDEGRADRLSYRSWSERLVDLLPRLPRGFAPDLFFDNQVLGSHLLPLGLEEAPFPTVGGFCHVFRGRQTLWTAELFDVLLPLSPEFAALLRRATDRHVLELPFGLNWGSFHELLPAGPPHAERAVDLSCTIGPARTWSGHSPARWRLCEHVRALAERHGRRFRIELVRHLPRERYLELLRQSRVSLNLDNFHGPANYRTCEIVASGAACVHLRDPEQFAVPTDLGRLLADGSEVVLASWDELEEKLLALLEDPTRSQAIADAGRRRLERDASYEPGYRRLFEELRRLALERPRRARADRASFALGATYWGYEDERNAARAIVALPGILAQPLETRLANLLALVPRMLALHGAEAVLGLLAGEPAVRAAFGDGAWAGVEALWRALPDHPVACWNHAMLAVEHGRAEPGQMHAALALLGPDGPAFDPAEHLLVTPRLPFVEEPEAGQARYAMFHHRVVAAWGERERTLALFRDWMRWNLLRWLHAHGEDHLDELVALWPDDSVLQLERGRRLAPHDPAAARRAFRRALAVDPGCEAAREALAAPAAAGA